MRALVTSILQRVVTEGTGQRAAPTDGPRPARPGRRRTMVTRGSSAIPRSSPSLSGLPGPAQAHGDRVRRRPSRRRHIPGAHLPDVLRALAHLEEPPESFPYLSYQSVVARQVVYRDNRTLLDNGNCSMRQILYFVGTAGPNAEATARRTRSMFRTSSAWVSPTPKTSSIRCR